MVSCHRPLPVCQRGRACQLRYIAWPTRICHCSLTSSRTCDVTFRLTPPPSFHPRVSYGCHTLSLKCECESVGLQVFRPERFSSKLKNALYTRRHTLLSAVRVCRFCSLRATSYHFQKATCGQLFHKPAAGYRLQTIIPKTGFYSQVITTTFAINWSHRKFLRSCK